MIIAFPVLTSSKVSKSIQLSICKSLEKYFLIFKTEEIISLINQKGGFPTKLSVRNKRFVFTEEKNLLEQKTKLPYPGTKGGLPPSPQDRGKKPADLPKIEMPKKDTLSVEPTWMTIESPQMGKQIIGIKAIPFVVRSDESLGETLLNDRYRGWYVDWVFRAGRVIMRLLFYGLRGVGFVIPWLRRIPATRWVKFDVLWGGTKYARDLFVLLSSADIPTTDFFDSPHKVNRLFKQGWTSFVVADDVNKKAFFCMSEYSGLCAEVPYGFMLQSLIGKDAEKIYEDLEDIKNSSGFFRVRKSVQKILDQLEVKLLNKNSNLKEDVFSVATSMTQAKVKSILSTLESAAKSKDSKKIKAIINKYTKTIPLDKVEKSATKLDSTFQSNYKFSQQVLQNSTELSEESTKPIAALIALASGESENAKKETKKNLELFVHKIRELRKEKSVEVVTTAIFIFAVLFVIKTIYDIISTQIKLWARTVVRFFLMLALCLIIGAIAA